jgi:NADPH-dependent 7-cyano-7-deazaguanine reductase QueF-like protein
MSCLRNNVRRNNNQEKVNQFFLKGARIKLFWNEMNKSKFNSFRNLEQIEIRDLLVVIRAENFVIDFAIQK